MSEAVGMEDAVSVRAQRAEVHAAARRAGPRPDVGCVTAGERPDQGWGGGGFGT